MKKFIIYALMCLYPIFSAAQDTRPYERHWKRNVEKVRIMSYNILDGFNWGNDLERKERLAKWVKEQNPEIVALQELCGFHEKELKQLASLWGHQYTAIVEGDAYPVGITSDKPIIVKKKIAGKIGHGLLHVQTYGIDILVTHLNPHDTDKRREESRFIAGYIRDNKLTDCILMGDMNSHSPMDADNLESYATDLTTKYGGRDSKNLIDGEIDYSVISNYLSVPMIDVCRKYINARDRFSYPTPVLMNQSRHHDIRRRSSERIDYIFMSPKVAEKVVDAFIYNEGETEYLSDHFPVAADIIVEHEEEK